MLDKNNQKLEPGDLSTYDDSDPDTKKQVKFLRPCVISSRKVILTLQNTRFMTSKFGTVLPITYFISQITKTN